MPLFLHGASLDSSLAVTGIGAVTPLNSLFYISPSNVLTSSDIYFTYFNQPTNSGSVTTASTVHIAGAPSGGTITNPYALNVTSGIVQISGTLQIPTGSSNGYILTSDANGNASWVSPSVASFTGFADGTLSTPGAYFLSQTNTGFYKPASGQILVSLAGINTVSFTATAMTSLVSLNLTGIGSTTFSSATVYINPASTPITGASTYYFTYLAAPFTAPTSFTGIANTLYIEGSPTSTTGGTGYALNISSGNVILSGASSSLLLNNTDPGGVSTGPLQVAGGAYFGANSLFGIFLYMTGTSSIFALTGTSSVVTLPNTGSNSAALVVSGGAYFGGNSIVSPNLSLNGSSSILALTGINSSLILSGTNISTSISTGTLRTSGGVGISKNIWLGGPFTGANASVSGSVFNIPAFTYTTSTTSPSNVNIATINQITLNGTGTASTSTTLYILGAPIPGTQAITNPYALQIATGDSSFSEFVIVGYQSTGSLFADSEPKVSLCGYNNLYFTRYGTDGYNDTVNQRLKLLNYGYTSLNQVGLIILNESATSTNAPVTQLSIGKAYSIRDQIDISFHYVGTGSTSNKLQFGYAGVAFDQFNIKADGSTNVSGKFTISAQPYYSVGGTTISIPNNSLTSLNVWTVFPITQGSGITLTFNNTYTVSNAGIYCITASINWGATGGGERTLQLSKNASVDRITMQGSAGGSGLTSNKISTVTKLAANDYVYLYGYQNSGGTLTATGVLFTIYRIS